MEGDGKTSEGLEMKLIYYMILNDHMVDFPGSSTKEVRSLSADEIVIQYYCCGFLIYLKVVVVYI